MSMLGKILAILNAAAAIAFVCLIAMDYGKRQAWAFAGYQHDLAEGGLPVDDKEMGADDEKKIDKLSKTALDAHFATAGGGTQVKTQIEEVNRVRGVLKGQIDGEDAATWAKAAKLAQILLPLASSEARREGLNRIRTAKGDVVLDLPGVFLDLPDVKAKSVEEDLSKKENREPAKHRELVTNQLEKEFNRAFDQTLDKKEPEELRQAIVALLWPLVFVDFPDPKDTPAALDSPGYKRLLAVCGVKAVQREIDANASLLRRLSQEVPLLTAEDMAKFVVDHRNRVIAIQLLEKQVNDRVVFLQSQKDASEKLQVAINTRMAEITAMRAKYDAILATNKLATTEQEKIELQLIEKLRELRDVASANRDLERKIRGLENVP
jgi:hypothetical protein